jgi:hypothetical protein
VSVVADILESWRRPSRVLHRHLSRGRSEPFAFTFLVVFLIVAFIAQWPDAARISALNPEIPIAAQLLPRALALLATIPVWYLLAALGRLVARALGGQGGWYEARLALFWTLVTISPMILMVGLVAGMIGAGAQLTILGAVTFAVFLLFWVINLRATGDSDAT